MTKEQQDLIRGSFAKIAPNAPAVAALFYERLFQLDPALRSLFKGDMTVQGQKLMTMIGTAVANLHHLDSILPAIEQLGGRHAQYGVKDADYATVGEALLWTLEHGLGDAFSPAVRDAWTICYSILAGVMQKAAAAV